MLDTSDVPAGVVNIVTGERDVLAKTIAEHDDVAASGISARRRGARWSRRASAGNLKATWVNHGRRVGWADPVEGQGRDFLRRATQVKNIWVPYGE